jgi:hypothetical protein
MGVPLDRQIQRRVGRMQIPEAGRPVRQPLHGHGAEHRLKRAHMTGLDPAARHPLITDDLIQALFADRAQREMVIKQPAQQLPPVAVKMLLKLGVREPRGVRPVQEAQQRLELLTARHKPGRHGRIAVRAAAPKLTSGCTIATSLRGRQEFIARGVKFATTGVEIGGHVGHLRGRRLTSATPTSTPDLSVLGPVHRLPAPLRSHQRPPNPRNSGASAPQTAQIATT